MPQSANRGLAAWPIRRKLIALVAVPILVIVVAGAWLTTSSVTGLRRAERTRALAIVALATNKSTVALDSELGTTLTTLRTPTTATRKAKVESRTAADKALADLNAELDQPPSGGWSGDVLMAASSMKLSAGQLPTARHGADVGTRAPLVVETSFDSLFRALRNLTSALSREIATTTADGTTVDQASMLSALASAAAAAADERATGTIAISENRLSELQLTGLKKLVIEQDIQLQIAATHASPEQQSDIDAIKMDDGRMKLFRKGLDELAKTRTPQVATDFSAATGQRLDNLDSLVGRVAAQTRDTAADGVRNALIGTILLGGFTVLTLLLVFATLAAIARTVTGPMRRLRSGAVEVATVRLPQAVRQIEQQGVDAHIDLPPVMPPGTVAGPETLEVAHAVDGLTAEAVRLATAQVRLRHALDEAFVSMSRRSQTMVEKQLAIIDELESTEEDPEQLRNLFRLDHLAARMRRYNDNLLVLAGSSVRTRSNTPVPVSDVFRAATSEMEQYERVRLQPVSNAAVSGPVAGGLIHLLAELLDNAAMYSPPTSPILLTAAFTPGGGLHLEVTDSGVGIPPAELGELNARLATPGTIDTQIPSRMGLFVVGRLGQRGGFEVRLSARASAAGTVAEVLVPATHVVGAPQGGGRDVPQQGRFPTPQQRAFGPLPPQSPPAPGLPGPSGMPPAGRPPAGPPPAGPPPAPAGTPAAGLPPASLPSPSLPRRPNLVWPGTDQPSSTTGAAAGPSTGGLPSRVPGAALSGGPLSGGPLSGGPLSGGPLSGGPLSGGPLSGGPLGGPGAGRNRVGPDSSPFDAFGTPAGERPPIANQPPPPGATPIAPSSATAAWSPQVRAARAAGLPEGSEGPPDTPGSFGTPGGRGRTGDPGAERPPFGPPAGFGGPPAGFGGPPAGFDGRPAGPAGPPAGFGGPPAGFGGPPAGFDGPPAGPAGRPSGLAPGALPGRTPSGSPQGDQAGISGSGLPTRIPSASFPPPPGNAPALPPFPMTRPGTGPDAPATRTPAGTGWPSGLPPTARDGERDTEPGGPPPLPTRPARGDGDPFATAKLFGVEMPDPATAAGLFTAGPKAGVPEGNRTGAPATAPDVTNRGDLGRSGPRQAGPPHSEPPHSGPSHSEPPHSEPPHSEPPHSEPPHSEPPHSGPSLSDLSLTTSSRSGADRSDPASPEPPSARGSEPAGPGGGFGERSGIDMGSSNTAPHLRGIPSGQRDLSQTGELPSLNFKPLANPSTAESGATSSNGSAPAAWEGLLPTEEAARSATNTRYQPSAPGSAMIGNLDYAASEAASPIFEAMSVWFSDQKTVEAPAAPGTTSASARQAPSAERATSTPVETGVDRGQLADQSDDLTQAPPRLSVPPGEVSTPGDRPIPAVPVSGKGGPQDAPRLIDLHDDLSAATPAPTASRWASLGDQQWLAANARAAAAPQVAGDTSAGLPRRQPGANLLPSAASAAPSAPAAPAPFHRADADTVRGRLGSYQRGVSSARQTSSHPGSANTTAAGLFTTARTTDTDQGHEPNDQGGEQ